jgi:hypothetical protein
VDARRDHFWLSIHPVVKVTNVIAIPLCTFADLDNGHGALHLIFEGTLAHTEIFGSGFFGE